MENGTWKQWPMTMEEAVDEVMAHLPEDIRKEMANTPKTDLIEFHDNLGRVIRNKLGLWAYCRGREASHFSPDEVSLRIIFALWEKLPRDVGDKNISGGPRSGMGPP